MRRALSRAALVGVALPLLVASTPAHADDAPDKQKCVEAYRQGQPLGHEGKLLEARDAFRTCARESCPVVLQRDCTQWLSEVGARLPTLVFAVRDPARGDLTEARVFIDDHLATEHLDGRAIAVNPGEHVVRFEIGHDSPVERHVVAREGDHERVIDLVLTPPAPPRAEEKVAPPPPVARRPVPWSTWMLGGVGFAGVATATTMGLIALNARSDFKASGSTSQAKHDRAVTDFLIADGALIVTAVAWTIATVVYFARPTVYEPAVDSKTARQPSPRLRVSIDGVGVTF